MSYVDMKLGYDCNNNCKHCIITNQRINAKRLKGYENRTTAECILEINDSIQAGHKEIVMTGGEPTLRNDFIELVRYAQRSGLTVSVQTNGRLFRTWDFAKEVSQYVEYYIVAIHGSNAEVHDRITRVQGSYEQTVSGIKNLVKLNKRVVAKVVISKDNMTDLQNILLLLYEIGVNDVNMAFPHACEEMLEHYDEIVPTFLELRTIVEKCISFAEESRINLEFESLLPCSLEKSFPLKYFADFKHYNDRSHVKQLDGDVIQWEEARKKIKRKITSCSKCVYDSICEGFWMEYIILRGDKEFLPIIQD